MKVVGFAGFSNSGKTTLVERLIPLLRAHGQRVSVVKHAHHKFDIDQPGKDTWRHRVAGAFEVVASSGQRMALMREYEVPAEPVVHDLIARLDPAVDWVLVEGFKESDLPKVEVWRSPSADYPAHPVRYGADPWIVAVAADAPAARLPAPPGALPVFDVREPAALADWLRAEGHRWEYRAGGAAPAAREARP
ncbi:molybdopterin-guanine dinucleotide biosynthesis protein B [Paracidovorax anthurii]|uniref:Molybdopterin guanine dinucleotide biosynthesis accessory protein MobB n=1 Tax=Paracidovorax anthurii TaxID=78229 RepID=A0A328Z6K9_9BURK|nr:molybdopterin-guanine dinucleotide biosynthesis protein B [Paracidovorax anthurii]RAR81830.1 molybdopterin guanine dinucleotide biosynthesis accessory protein MobB [Paracidovorax anthurii]